MAQENVDVVRAAFAAWNAGEEMDAYLSRFHPQLVYHPRGDEPDPSPHIGRDAYARLVLGYRDALPDMSFDMRELIDAGDRVIASTVVHGRGVASGADVTDTYVFLCMLRDGLIVECWEYGTRQEALEAVGLSE